MNKFFSLAVAGLAAATVAGCGGLQLQKAEKVAPQGSQFDKTMAADYLALSKSEYGQGDYRDSDIFAGRAMSAAAGSSPAPEEVSARKLPSDTVGELTAARGRLTAAYAAGAKEKMPDASAHAQAYYECWMEQQEENWPFQKHHVKMCKDGFLDCMAKIEAALAGAPRAGGFLVFFDWDKSSLTKEGTSIVQNVAATAKSANFSKIMATGHADTSGSAQYNLGLSARRAATVKAALIKMGLSGDKIVTAGKGETQPLVPTKDGVREPQNRRVEIVIEK
jgi:outer membrane protein OmpA-like peptidoglycan-associated protein